MLRADEALTSARRQADVTDYTDSARVSARTRCLCATQELSLVTNLQEDVKKRLTGNARKRGKKLSK